MACMMAILGFALAAVLFGVYNRRWAVACALFVLHIVIGGFIIGCMVQGNPERQKVASPNRPCTLGYDSTMGDHRDSWRGI